MKALYSSGNLIVMEEDEDAQFFFIQEALKKLNSLESLSETDTRSYLASIKKRWEDFNILQVCNQAALPILQMQWLE